jgi:hypothetical protein
MIFLEKETCWILVLKLDFLKLAFLRRNALDPEMLYDETRSSNAKSLYPHQNIVVFRPGPGKDS